MRIGGERLLIVGVVFAAAASAVAIGVFAELPLPGIAAAIALIAALGALGLIRVRDAAPASRPSVTDWTMVRAVADGQTIAVLLTNRDGQPVCANQLFEDRFGGIGFDAVPFADQDRGAIVDVHPHGVAEWPCDVRRAAGRPQCHHQRDARRVGRAGAGVAFHPGRNL